MSLKVAVLALQGAFYKHILMLKKLGVQAVEVRKPEELAGCDGLIIPGGESTAICKQIHFIEFAEPLRAFAKQKPVFGTCAGLILMAREVINNSIAPFQLLDIKVERNAFGSQKESFQTEVNLILEESKEQPFPAIFIRAPRIREIGSKVQVLGKLKQEPVLVRQGLHLGSTFHPELGSNEAVHAYFLKIIKGKV